MFRKIILAIAGVAAIGAAALNPTPASAQWHGHGGWSGHHRWHSGPRFGIGIYAPAYAFAPRCYIVRRWVRTPFGPRLRRVQVCN
jgi:hypothetical protein